MPKSMVSVEHYNAVRLERDQLKSRVSELENIIATGWQQLAFADAQGEKAEEIAMFVYRYLSTEVKKNTPAQSLLIHDAEVLEKFAKTNRIYRDGRRYSETENGMNKISDRAFADAANLRLQAKEKANA